MRTNLPLLFTRLAAASAAVLMSTSAALASTGGGSLPWDGPITMIEQDLSGTVAHAIILIAIVSTGLMWAFGEHGSSMRKVMGIAAGGSLALGASSLVSGLGLGSGAVIGGAGLYSWAYAPAYVAAALIAAGLSLIVSAMITPKPTLVAE